VSAVSPGLSSVSIVVPVLNEMSTIRASLHRLQMDFPDCELVVVDGGSTDGTVQARRRWPGCCTAGGAGRCR